MGWFTQHWAPLKLWCGCGKTQGHKKKLTEKGKTCRTEISGKACQNARSTHMGNICKLLNQNKDLKAQEEIAQTN